MPVILEVTSHLLSGDEVSDVTANGITKDMIKRALGPLSPMFNTKTLNAFVGDNPLVLSDLQGRPKYTIRVKKLEI